MLKKALCSLFVVCLLLLPTVTYGDSDESWGYRYRISFEIKDEVGKAIVHVYANTWVYNQNPASNDSYVWLGNPHQDITPAGDLGLEIVPGGCVMLVGKGLSVIERRGANKQFGPHESLTISHSVVVYDFFKKVEIKFENTKCRK